MRESSEKQMILSIYRIADDSAGNVSSCSSKKLRSHQIGPDTCCFSQEQVSRLLIRILIIDHDAPFFPDPSR